MSVCRLIRANRWIYYLEVFKVTGDSVVKLEEQDFEVSRTGVVEEDTEALMEIVDSATIAQFMSPFVKA